MTKKLWSGRFAAATHPDVENYTASIQFDSELIFEDILGSLAHAAMLNKCELISKNDYEKIAYGLKQIANKASQGVLQFRIEDEDIHMNIERLLGEEMGDVALKLHTARSRNDQIALDMHLYLRNKIVSIVHLLTQLQETLLTMAKTNSQVILPGYTHLQRAQPIYFADHCLAYVSMFQRDIDRLQDCWQRLNISPLGACALAGSTLPIDKQFVADALGFDGTYLNTLDAVSDRDYVIEFLSASSLIMMHISRFSEELILWSSQEFNFVSFDDAYSTGSSIMPQKKNPDVAELSRGKTGRVYGSLLTLLTLLKGLPLAYNKDLQEDKEPLFDTVKTVSQTLTIFVKLLSTLKIHSEAMRNAVNQGYTNATSLAEFLVKQGVAFRNAHEIVGKMVAFCIEKNCQLEALTLTEMQQFCEGINDAVYQTIHPENIVAAYRSQTKDLLKTYQEQNNQNDVWVKDKMKLLHSIYTAFGLPLVI